MQNVWKRFCFWGSGDWVVSGLEVRNIEEPFCKHVRVTFFSDPCSLEIVHDRESWITELGLKQTFEVPQFCLPGWFYILTVLPISSLCLSISSAEEPTSPKACWPFSPSFCSGKICIPSIFETTSSPLTSNYANKSKFVFPGNMLEKKKVRSRQCHCSLG